MLSVHFCPGAAVRHTQTFARAKRSFPDLRDDAQCAARVIARQKVDPGNASQVALTCRSRSWTRFVAPCKIVLNLAASGTRRSWPGMSSAWSTDVFRDRGIEVGAVVTAFGALGRASARASEASAIIVFTEVYLPPLVENSREEPRSIAREAHQNHWGKRMLSARALAAIALFALASCSTPQYEPLVGNFGQSVAKSSNAIQGYYASINDVARQAYIDQIIYTKELKLVEVPPDASPVPMAIRDGAGNSTALVTLIDPASIKARTDALQIIAVYGDKLTALSTSSAPTQIDTSSEALGADLKNLGSTIQALTAPGQELAKTDKTLGAYAGPVSALVGSLGRMYAQRKVDDAIKEAVNNAAPQVNKILDLIDADLNSAIQPLEKIYGLQALSNRVIFYNQLDQRLTDEVFAKSKPAAAGGKATIASSDLLSQMTTRRTLADQVATAAANYAQLTQIEPEQLTQAIRTAHAALLKYANGDHSPQNLAELAAAFQAFNATVTSIATPISQLDKAIAR